MGEEVRGGKGVGMLPACSGSFILRAGSFGEVLGENLNRLFISFMLICQYEIYSLNLLSLGMVDTNGTNWISVVSLPE